MNCNHECKQGRGCGDAGTCVGASDALKPLYLAPGVLDDGQGGLDAFIRAQRHQAAMRVLTWVGIVQAVLVVVFMAAGYLAGKS